MGNNPQKLCAKQFGGVNLCKQVVNVHCCYKITNTFHKHLIKDIIKYIERPKNVNSLLHKKFNRVNFKTHR